MQGPAIPADISHEIQKQQKEIFEAKKRIVALKKSIEPRTIRDYEMTQFDGSKVNLSELFGDKSDLIIVHNMGKGCQYCTLWADGFVSLLPHLENRAAFVVVSNDAPETQKEFHSSRNWNFRMVSASGSSFSTDHGMANEDNQQYPGMLTFRKTDKGEVQLVAWDFFGPGDDYCSVWPFLEHLADGPNGWAPKFKY